MRISKTGKLLLGGSILLLLSVLVITRAGGFWHAQTPKNDDEDRLVKGYRLSLEQKFEEAYGSFRVAWTLALMFENDSVKAMEALKGMGNCAFWMGEVDSCICQYKEAVVLAHELNRPYDEYEIYSQLKQAYMAKVDMESVLQITQKIDSLTLNSTDMRIRIGLNQRLAMEAMQQGSPQLTEHYLLLNEILLDSLPETERRSEQFTVYVNLRDFYFNMQDFDRAKKYSHLYIGAAKKYMVKRQMGYMAYDGEALICAQQKNRKAAFVALDSMKYGLTLKEETSQTNVMRYHDVAGRVHAMFGEWENASKEYRKALETVDGTLAAGRLDYFRIVQLLGASLFQSKKYNEARACYAEVARYCKHQYGEESLAYADVLWALATLESKTGEKNAGKKYFTTSVDVCKKLVTGQLRYISVQERNAFWMSFAPKMFGMTAYAIKIGEEQSQFTRNCYEALLFSKALLLESDRTLAAAISTECTPEEKQAYYEMLGLQNKLKALMNDYEKNNERIEKLHEKISKQNKLLTPIISKLGYTSFLEMNYGDIKQSLGDDELLLDFADFTTEDGVYQHAAFIIDRTQKYPKLKDVFTEDKIKLLLKGNPIDFLYKEPYASKALSLIWKPLENEIRGKKTIYYVPAGILHKIALESIPLEDGTLLGDHYCFVRITSAREIARLKHHNQTALHASAMLYGALKYDVDATMMSNESSHYHVEPLFALNRGEIVRGNGPFRDLPNAKEEIDRIEKVLKAGKVKVTPRTGTKGTEESFLSLSGKAPNILHVATHGFYYTADRARDVNYLKGYNDAMMLSGLIMSGGNLAWTGHQVPKGVLGGVLTANNIASMDLRGTELLVLSACQTGLGIATPEGLFGLQRAFKKAGVQTMVMSLWNVDDEATKDFMIKFYEELASNNWDKRTAFEKSKAYVRSKTYIRKGKVYKGDPYYWASFVMLD